MPFAVGSHPGVLHHYAPRLSAFEFSTNAGKAAGQPHNFLLWIGGLTDGLLTVRYPTVLASRLPSSWGVAQVLLSSSYTGWATSSLAKDADELNAAVQYFRDLAQARSKQVQHDVPTRIVIMGHSTGAQDAMEYCVGPLSSASVPQATLARHLVDGIILQGGISDREGLVELMTDEEMQESLNLAREWVSTGRGSDIIPWDSGVGAILGTSPAASRWLSLASSDPAEALDDYFSSDLDDSRVDRIWGALASRKVPVLVLMGAKDEHIPPHINIGNLVAKWKRIVEDNGGVWGPDSGVLPGATHNLNRSGDEAVSELYARVASFLESLDAGEEKL